MNKEDLGILAVVIILPGLILLEFEVFCTIFVLQEKKNKVSLKFNVNWKKKIGFCFYRIYIPILKTESYLVMAI